LSRAEELKEPRVAHSAKNPGQSQNWYELSLLSLLVGLALYWTIRYRSFSFDDAYITYRYARNIASGLGFVYNQGEHVLGTTTPLYALLLAGLSWLWPNIPLLSVALGGLGWAASIILIYLLGRRTHPLSGLIAAALLVIEPLMIETLGMETMVYVALCLLALYLQMTRHIRLAVVVAGLAFLTRWEGVLVFGVVLLAEWLATHRLPWRAGLVFLLVTGPWLVFSQLYFGSIFPNTFFAKVGQIKTGLVGGGADPFWQTLLNIVKARLTGHWLFRIELICGFVGLGVQLRQVVPWWPVLFWTALYTLGYSTLGVVGFHWYYLPLTPAFALLVAHGVSWLHEWWSYRSRWRWASWAIISLLTLACLWPQGWIFWQFSEGINSIRVDSYRKVSAWLAQNTPPDSSVALLEVGAVGFYTDRYVVDMMGLVTPSTIGHLDNWGQIHFYAVTRYWPDYVVALRGTILDGPTPNDWFRRIYSPVAAIQNPADRGAPMQIFKRRPDFPPTYDQAWETSLTFDNQFRLEKIETRSDLGGSGVELPVRLTWRILADIKQDYLFDFELVNLTLGERWPLHPRARPFYEGVITDQWRRGETYVEDRLCVWPEATPPGTYRLLVRAYQGGNEVGPVTLDGRTTWAMTGAIKTAQAPKPLALLKNPVDFTQNIRLVGYSLKPDADSDRWLLILYWETQRPVSQDYTAFVHVFDENGQLVAQHDSPPVLGQLPMELWEAGVPVLDPHPLTITSQPKTFCVGMYDPTTFARLEILSAPGYLTHDNVVCQSFSATP